MRSKVQKSLLFRVVSFTLTFALSLYNAGLAATGQNLNAPDIAAPQSVLSVEDIGIAIDCGTIKSKYSGNTGKVIVHIQDAHCNYEAQSNISRMLEQLTKECGIKLISVEGAEGIVDTAWFRAFPDAEIRKEVATYFMKKGEITGAEFFSIVSDYDGVIFGAETRDYYVKNLKAFTEVYPYKDIIEKYFINMRTIANRLKSIVYPPKLKELDSKIRAFDDKELELSDFVRYLHRSSREYGMDLKDCVNFKKLLQTLEYENKIDFDIVDQERSEYIDTLAKKLSKEEMTELVTWSIRFKKGHIKPVEFYSMLRELAKKYNIPIMREYPNLFYYHIYTKLYDGIDNEKLFKEIDTVEARLKKRLFRNEIHEKLDIYSDMLNMFVSLINIELTNEDYNLFERYLQEFSIEDVVNFIKRLCDKYSLNYAIDGIPVQIKEQLPKMVDFYKIAMKRDDVLIDNTLEQMEKEGKDRCVLIAGGFHTKGIKSRLEKKGVSYVVVTPKITKDVETPYIKVLTNQRTSLEDIITESTAMPGVGVAASREEITRPKGDMLAPLLRVAYTIPLLLQSPDDLEWLSQAVGDVEGKTLATATEGSYRDIVSANIRAWLMKVKEKSDPEVWAKAVENWPLLLGVYLRKYEEAAEEAHFRLPKGFRVPALVLSEDALDAISAEFRAIFKAEVIAQRQTPGTEAVRVNGGCHYESLTQEQARAMDEVISGLMKKEAYKGPVPISVTAHREATKTRAAEEVTDQIVVYRLIGFREAIEEYNRTHEVQIPQDVRVHPGTGMGKWVRLYLDERDWNALDKGQKQRLANHEFYHILNPDRNESDVISAFNDPLMDIRDRFRNVERERVVGKLRTPMKNFAELNRIVEKSEGVKEVLAITNGGDGNIVREAFYRLRSFIFRKDGNVRIVAHEEKTRRGQFLGLLDAMESFGAFDPNGVALGIMMPGKGTRMSPLTQTKHGIKPLIPMLIRTGRDRPWLSGAAASLYTWNLVANYLQKMGFRGIAWKWGDEPQIASTSLKKLFESGMDLSNTDIVRFGSKVLVTDDLARNKEWLNAKEDGTFVAQVRRRERAALLKRLGISDTPDARAFVHIGSPAFSYLFLQKAREVFRDYVEDEDKRKFWIDVDGYLIEALTQDRETWEAEKRTEILAAVLKVVREYYTKGQRIDVRDAAEKINLTPGEFERALEELARDPALVREERISAEGVVFFAACGELAPTVPQQDRKRLKFKEPGIHELERNCPDFYERCQKLRQEVEKAKGAPFEIKVVDFGEDLYWGDIGQLSKARRSLYQVAEESPDGIFARRLAALSNIERDRYGNLVSGDCVYPQDGSVRNSVLINTRIYGKVDIDGAVVVNSDIGYARIKRGSVVFDSTVLHLVMDAMAFSFNSVATELNIPAGWVHTTMPADMTDIARGLEDWFADSTKDVGDARYYKEPQFGNPRSFEQQQARMRQREIPPHVIDNAVRETFRKPMIERMKLMAERRKKFKELGFGTSGIRGLVTDMTDMEVYINTVGFIRFLREIGDIDDTHRIIAVGGDLRSSTPSIAAAVIKAIRDEGCVEHFCGEIPSPTLAYYAMQYKYPDGVRGVPSIMVTGSHIPDDRNGIKYTKRAGEVLKADEAPIMRNVASIRIIEYAKPLEESCFDRNGKFRVPQSLPAAKYKAAAVKLYVKRYVEGIPEGFLKGKRIAIYQHSAVGRDIFQTIFEKLGATVIAPTERIEVTYVDEGTGKEKREYVDLRSEGIFIPVDTEKVTNKTKAVLRYLSEKYHPHVIMSLDGDSDRPLFADENGMFLPGDKLGTLSAQFLRPEFIAIPVSANRVMIREDLKKRGIKVKKTKIGSPYVIKAGTDYLEEHPHAKVAVWEANGGFLTISDFEIPGAKKPLLALPTRDAILPLILAAGQIAEGQAASQFVAERVTSYQTASGVIDNKTPGCERYTAEMGKEIKAMFLPQDMGIAEARFGRDTVTAVDENEKPYPLTERAISQLLWIKERLETYLTAERGFYSPIVALNFVDSVQVIFEGDEVTHFRPSSNAPEFRNYAGAWTLPRAEEIAAQRYHILPQIIAERTDTSGPRSPGMQAVRTEPTGPLAAIIAKISEGKTPLRLLLEKAESRNWGTWVKTLSRRIAEFWVGPGSSVKIGKDEAELPEVIEHVPGPLLGTGVVEHFGTVIPRTKIIIPEKWLSVQVHDTKNELWIVTEAVEGAEIILGFNPEIVEQYRGKEEEMKAAFRKVAGEYNRTLGELIRLIQAQEGGREQLESQKDVLKAAEMFSNVPAIGAAVAAFEQAGVEFKRFFHYRSVKAGDIIPIPAGTMHALGPGVTVIEPQIPGPTQRVADLETWFPLREMQFEEALAVMKYEAVREAPPTLISKKEAPVVVRRMPGMFESKGMEVHMIDMPKGERYKVSGITSYHKLLVLKGQAKAVVKGKTYEIPTARINMTARTENELGVEMFLIPASVGEFEIVAGEEGTQVVDIFTPVPEVRELGVPFPQESGEEIADTGVRTYETSLSFLEFPTMISTVDQVSIIESVPVPSIIGGRAHFLTVLEGAVSVEGLGEEPIKLIKGQRLPVSKDYNPYRVTKVGTKNPVVRFDYEKTREEEIVYATYEMVRKHFLGIQGGQVDLILPEEMFVPGGRNTPGSAQWEQEQLRKYVSDKIRITTYSAKMGLKEAAKKTINKGAVGVLVATRSNITEMDKSDREIQDFLLYGKKGRVRMLAIPDIDKAEELKDKGWYFNREVEATALLLASVTPDQIAVEGEDNAADDLQKLMAQLTGNAIPRHYLYYLLSRNEIDLTDALARLPVELQDDPFGWLSFLVNNLLLRMPIKPFDPTAQLHQRRKVMWSV